MRLLDRYLLRELLVPLAVCLSGFLSLWIALDLFSNLRDFQEKKLHGFDVAQYYMVSTPEFLITVLPVALLLGLLYTLTNHARHHEITAIRAAGVSLWRLSLPYLMVGLLGSVLLFAISEFWVPDSSATAERIKLKRVNPSAAGQKNTDLNFKNTADGRLWVVRQVDPRTGVFRNLVVRWKQPDGSYLDLRADSAEHIKGVWQFRGVAEYRDSLQPGALPELCLKTNQLAMPQFAETPEQIRSGGRIGAMMDLSRGAKRADLPVWEILNYLRFNPQLSRGDKAYLLTKLHGRLAAPWTCLMVVLIAIPFGAPSGRRNVLVGVASSIVICFAYFVVQQVGLALGAGGSVPPWIGAWAPNLVFGFTGVWLTSKVR
jgi:lipopolysaccharide export system permease protein